ncbi:transglutaminase domain-containing protein [Candidatus Woesearchaeota archaeon]|jgi:transglutaminase-like putative cysteine protease|nr:transglutaminase domain-containing protein [Candidatus Woesearchaeota archaeon]MBT4114570.1 transglutaminase domain-containing protein [Candidatus Woesearchaeota archaeon]MBT4248080.1 transglutaminase domain-containing protein [Candidatus Woesearchaeota archaeon]
MTDQANLLEHFEEEFDEIKKPSPFRWLLAAFLIFIMLLWLIPAYQIAVDPPPDRIPTLSEVSTITTYEPVTSGSIQDYVIIDSEIKTVADKIAVIACDSNQKKCQAKAMFGFVKDNFEYVSDPSKFEYMKTARESLVNGGGDCDDASILLSTLLESVGISTRFVFVPGHVYVEAWINNEWEPMDATCAGCNFGEIHWKYNDDEKRVVIV